MRVGTMSLRVASVTAGTAVFALLAAGCTEASVEGGTVEQARFEYGASQDELDELLENLGPVTITYQPTTSGPQSSSARVDLAFAEEIEQRSNGKITVDIAWAQAIASYAEIDDALADGRLDIGRTIPSYHPDKYPTFAAIDTVLGNLKSSPHVAEVAANAVGVDFGWNSEGLMEEYDAQDLSPIVPLFVQAGNYMVCNSEGVTAEDFKGRQIRIASAAISDQTMAMGASPVSMEYTEVFEALQRGTIDCTVGKLASLAETGVLEVAPHVSYPSSVSFSKAPSAIMAGRNYGELPLVYKQIIFDAQSAFFAASMGESVGNNIGIRTALEYGGEVSPFDEEVDSLIAERNDSLIAEVTESGLLGSSPVDQLRESESTWVEIAEELGLSDGGDFADLPEWYDTSMDYRPFADRVYEDLVLPHRPQ